MNDPLGVLVTLPILAAVAAGEVLVAVAAVPAIALAVFRVERAIRAGADGPPW